jgi:hypothetical protein
MKVSSVVALAIVTVSSILIIVIRSFFDTMPRFAIIDAPSILGLRSTGVQDLPESLKRAGLHEKLGAEYAGHVNIQIRNLKIGKFAQR